MSFHALQPARKKPLNRSSGVARGLLACWLLDEGGGQRAFDSVTNQIGTLSNSALFKDTTLGHAVNFPQTAGNAVTVATAGCPSGVIVRSMRARIMFTAFPTATSSTWMSVFSKGYSFGAGATDMDLEIAFYESGGLQLQIYFGSDGTGVVNTTISGATAGITTLGVWYDIITTWNGTTGAQNMSVYVNGKLVGNGVAVTATNLINRGWNLTIGRGASAGPTSAYPFAGNIQNVMFWNRPLTASEVRFLYANPYFMFS